MNTIIKVQGRLLHCSDIDLIRALIDEHPHWGRTRLSQELCRKWTWKDQVGRLKDMACRTMLLKLEKRGLLQLPKSQSHARANQGRAKNFQPVLHSTTPVKQPLAAIRPIRLLLADTGVYRLLWQTLLTLYHYLGFTTRVGHSLSYLAMDNQQQVVGCLLFGAAAWKVADRDRFIGWTPTQRENRLSRIVNNMRFLIPPWVTVHNLASHLLALATERLQKDWQAKYGFEPFLVETFVEQGRFLGTCYQAANWKYVGKTTGRTRQDRYSRIQAPIKDIYLYALNADFKNLLCGEYP